MIDVFTKVPYFRSVSVVLKYLKYLFFILVILNSDDSQRTIRNRELSAPTSVSAALLASGKLQLRQDRNTGSQLVYTALITELQAAYKNNECLEL